MITKTKKTIFDILDFGKEFEEQLILQKEYEDFLWRKEVEDLGVCEHCGSSDDFLDWDEDGGYVCYDCFYNNLDNWASVMVPSRAVKYMANYMSEDEWMERKEQRVELEIKKGFRP